MTVTNVEFNFRMTFQEAQLVVAALKKLPMEHVEALVQKLDGQFISQNAPKDAPPSSDVEVTAEKAEAVQVVRRAGRDKGVKKNASPITRIAANNA